MAVIPIEAFEPTMPPAMRALVVEARAMRGPLVWLLNERTRASGGNCQAMLRGNPPLPVEIVGWAAGIAMFDANPRFIADIIRTYTVRAPIPFLLEAIGTGLSAGVEASVELWKCLDPLLRMSPQVPDTLMRAMPLGVTSSSSITRAAALGVIRRDPARAKPMLEAVRLKKISATHATRLEEVLATLEPSPVAPTTSPDATLLTKLLEAWRATFDPKLEAPIIAAGAAEAARRGPLRASSKAELEQSWLALAARKDPGDVDRLFGTPWPGAWKSALKRVEALAPFPPDPRFAQLAKHTARYTSWAGRAVGQAVSRVTSKHAQPKRGEASKELLNEAASVTTHVADLEGLWKAFWENPLDEARRVVLADALQHAGDPRGEFITLQIAIDEGRADAAAEKRARELLKSHIDSWAGSLPGAELASREFRRGFLSAITIRPDEKHLTNALEQPQWRTVERLGINYLSIYGAVVGQLLARMPSLHTLVFNQSWLNSDLERVGGPFPRVKVICADDWIPLAPLAAFPSLRLVCARAKDPRVALQAAKRSGLKGLMLRGDKDVERILSAFEAGPPEVEELRVAPSMSRDPDPRGWVVCIRRDAPTEARLLHTGRFEVGSFSELAKVLAARGRTTLHVHCAVAVQPKIEKEAASATLSFDHRPFDVFN